MSAPSILSRSVMVAAGLGLGVSLVGCAHVGQDELDQRLGQLREEVRQADQENADRIEAQGQRVDALERRVGSVERDLQALQDGFDTTVERLESSLRFSTPVHFAYDATEIRAVSYGEDATRPILPEGAGPGESGIQNRRVVLVVDYVARQSVGSSSAPSQGAESGF